MASERYPYPTALDSDDEGSIEYDWDNDSQYEDDLSSNMDRLQLGRNTGTASGTPPPSTSHVPLAHLLTLQQALYAW